MNVKLSPASIVAGACLFAAMADPLSVQATMVSKEQIKLDFKDGSGHFVLMVRREGNAAGTGVGSPSICHF